MSANDVILDRTTLDNEIAEYVKFCNEVGIERPEQFWMQYKAINDDEQVETFLGKDYAAFIKLSENWKYLNYFIAKTHLFAARNMPLSFVQKVKEVNVNSDLQRTDYLKKEYLNMYLECDEDERQSVVEWCNLYIWSSCINLDGTVIAARRIPAKCC